MTRVNNCIESKRSHDDDNVDDNNNDCDYNNNNDKTKDFKIYKKMCDDCINVINILKFIHLYYFLCLDISL